VGTNRKLFISLADLSAEKYAYYIIKEIITKDENIEVLVVAGDKIKELADQINNKYSFNRIKFISNSIKYSSVGFFENFGYIPFAYIEYIKLKEILKKEKPNYVLLIDAPFLNTKLIKYLRSLYNPVIIYLIPPKTWLNKRDKVHKFIEETCDYIILPFRFNLILYKKSYFFGHPLLDIVNLERGRYIYKSKDKLNNKEKNNLGIFPGSRKFELLFISKDALNIIQDRDIYTIFDKFLISSLIQNNKILINSLKKGNIDKINNIKIEIVKDNMEIYQNSLLALSKSGTIVFENILNNLPTIAYYKVFKISEITFKLLKKIEVKYISIPNLLIEYEFKDEMISNLPSYLKDDYLVVEELIQDQYNLYNLKSKLFRVYNEIESYNFKIRVFNEILRAYYPKDSLKKISDFILNIINK
jgi:lipid-A-disaccharide synthase